MPDEDDHGSESDHDSEKDKDDDHDDQRGAGSEEPADRSGDLSSDRMDFNDVLFNPDGDDWDDLNALGGDDYAQELAALGDRFSDWAANELSDNATGSALGSVTAETFELRPGAESSDQYDLGPDVGKSEGAFDTLVHLLEGRPDLVSDKGIEAYNQMFDIVFKGSPEHSEEEAREQVAEAIVEAAGNPFGLESPKQQSERMSREIEERRSLSERWLNSHDDWWKSGGPSRDPSQQPVLRMP